MGAPPTGRSPSRQHWKATGRPHPHRGAQGYTRSSFNQGHCIGKPLLDNLTINDTLAVFRIDAHKRKLIEVTAADMPATIFGVDDGEATVYGLCTYTSPKDGETYAFATQADGNLVAQVRLFDDGAGKVMGEVVRTLELPVPTGDPGDSQAEGIAADRELGSLYVAMEEEVGILKFEAEPDGGDAYTVVQAIDEPYFSPDIGGPEASGRPGSSARFEGVSPAP
jgi:myo-inositol-hexaphosphate 3-phosphohydrolase